MGSKFSMVALLQIVSVAAAAVAVVAAADVTEHALDSVAEHVAAADTVNDFAVATEPENETTK